jgi:S-adenosylmethionine:tRNA-ribosyltransferase-isomerase (queuine synthetase)
MLVGTFAGQRPAIWDRKEAIRQGYRFYSFGDALMRSGLMLDSL